MDEFNFKNVWVIDAPIEMVWDVIAASEHWPEWWPYLDSVVEVCKGELDGTGSIRRFIWGGSLPYRLSFQIMVTKVNHPRLIEGVASGDLEGLGRWLLANRGGGSTEVEYSLNVRSTKSWMRMLSPFLRWFFTWNHNRVMESGRRGLASYLRCMEKPVALAGGKKDHLALSRKMSP